jgi:NADH-quinone oxidoreductase subunit C
VPTISDLFPTCDWHERETMEMFGIRFEGHPHPVKLLLAEPFEGFPLRKDFPLMPVRPSRGPGPSRARKRGGRVIGDASDLRHGVADTGSRSS